MNKLYNYLPDGYCGDEDNGQTSAWYVFSAMGFYPVTPGTNEYVIGSPMFNKITLQFENGKNLVIEAPVIVLKFLCRRHQVQWQVSQGKLYQA